jgi:hypothetical protein
MGQQGQTKQSHRSDMPGHLKPRCLLNSECCFLCGPVEWEIDPLGQSLGCEVRWRTALGNRFDDFGRKECQPEQAPHVTTGNPFALCDNCRDESQSICNENRFAKIWRRAK